MSAPPAWWTDLRASLAPALRNLRVAFYASGGAPYHHAALVAQWGGRPVPLSGEAIRAGMLDRFDVLVVPGGGLRAMEGLLGPLGVSGAEAVQSWVRGGGMYVGSCAGSYLPAAVPESFAERHPEVRPLRMLDVPLANGADAGLGGLDSPGVGALEVRVEDPEHWLVRGLPEHFKVVHYNGPCFRPPLNGPVRAVTRLVRHGADFTPWERSLPGSADPLVDALVRERAPNVVSGDFGRGIVVLFGSHPEFGFDALQLGWGVAAELFGNALLHQAERRDRSNRPEFILAATPAPTPPSTVADRLARAAQRFQKLRDRAPKRLDDAPAFLGLGAPDLWRSALAEAAELTERTATYLRALAAAGAMDPGQAHWLDRSPRAGQDYGFVGLAQLADRLHELMDAAESQLRFPLPHVDSPYDAWDRHPYHLLASSYLSAAGVAASASLAAGTLGQLTGFGAPVPYPVLAPHKELL